jgi:tryptophan synthase alpha chain
MGHTLQDFLLSKRKNGEKILSIYLPAGYPDLDSTVPMLSDIADAGADLIELGIPFSDPLADGPTIQFATQVALQNGITLPKALEMLAAFKKHYATPVVLMGYSNPFMHYGWEQLFQKAQAMGASGLIVPDIPPEESVEICRTAETNGISLIFLVAPNTPPNRIALINRLSKGFIYAVSLTGVTGARKELPKETTQFLQRLKSQTDLPVLVGFGISNAETAASVAAHCDGVIIGSALINIIRESESPEKARTAVKQFVSEIKAALNS